MFDGCHGPTHTHLTKPSKSLSFEMLYIVSFETCFAALFFASKEVPRGLLCVYLYSKAVCFDFELMSLFLIRVCFQSPTCLDFLFFIDFVGIHLFSLIKFDALIITTRLHIKHVILILIYAVFWLYLSLFDAASSASKFIFAPGRSSCILSL